MKDTSENLPRSPALAMLALGHALSIWFAGTCGAQTFGQPVRGADPANAPRPGLHFSAKPEPEEIFRARVFEEPLVPIGGEPGVDENTALATALSGYAQRIGPDDFSSLTGFLEKHPQSSWNAALLTGLGLEYYNTAHYSKALAAWQQAWALAKGTTDSRGKAVADRAAGELAYMYARLGRMQELEALLKSVEGRVFVGSATEKIAGAREGLWNMQNRPEISFRCGPLALHRISRLTGARSAVDMEIFNSASTQKGLSLPQVAELSKKVGLNYQMAFRGPLTRPSDTLSPSGGEGRGEGESRSKGDFVVPSVVHWKVGHYAAMVRQEGDKYLLEDPTFGNTVWATRAALEAETSGYFLIPPGPLPKGWRIVEGKEGDTILGKGVCSNNDPKNTGPGDPAGGQCHGGGGGGGGPIPIPFPNERMAASRVHLMLVNLNLVDSPVGYLPPVGPAVEFTVRYSHREAYQPGIFAYSNFGPKWTCDWISYITDNPQSTAADVNHYVRGGGTRSFTGFNTNSQTFAFQQYDQTHLTRTGSAAYEMVSPNGSKLVFGRSDGSVGTSRKIFLSQVVDPFGNTVTLNYDSSLRLTNITDAIGQATTLSYTNSDSYKITSVTDPFGRAAHFQYDALGRLTNITDVIGITSRFTYEGSGDFVNALVTPYGTTSFTRGSSGTTRWLETLYPDGSKERVEFNQSTGLGVPDSDAATSVPQGMSTANIYLYARNTYYWSRSACATGYGDYTKAKVFHWLHNADLSITSGILESTKEALEGRVWYDYDGQSSPIFVGSTDRPKHVGRVLDDGSTQLYTYGYNAFGNVTNTVDPLGRTFSYVYDTNGIDLLEVRMTRAGQNQLLYQATYNAQHLPLTTTDAAGQTTTNTYNARGQLLTASNPKGETTTYNYDTNGYLIAVDGSLPGTNDTVTAIYDSFGRTQTKTDESGYIVTLSYDALDRITNITFPDATFQQTTYDRLQPSILQDRAGRQTVLEHDPLGNLTKRTDPLGRVTRFQWCNCGDIKSITDPMGRTTEWHTDVQGRPITKQYGDGSKITFSYENASGRLRQIVDEKLQVKQFTYNRDNTIRSVSYPNAAIATPSVSYSYDPDYVRRISMSDGVGTTVYSHVPITGTSMLGAGQLASVDGPYANDTITYSYDELGRQIVVAINGVSRLLTFDAAGRKVTETNALGIFGFGYDGASRRVSELYPNGQTTTNIFDDNLNDGALQRITHKVGIIPVSDMVFGRDIAKGRIVTWSRQFGADSPNLHAFGYDAADQLLSVAVTNSGALVGSFAYEYDPAGNRLTEVATGVTNAATYNALNQISTSTAMSASRTNEWDAEDRLVAVTMGSQRTEFSYDGEGRLASVRLLTNSVEASLRRFVWYDQMICQERDASGGAVTKRYFDQGVVLATGTNVGSFYYVRDHLGSIHGVTDTSGSVRARYTYDPYGRRTLLSGDVDVDFGFARMFELKEASLFLTKYRAYDPENGRWISRDPLPNAELEENVNLYTYVGNNPVNLLDILGLESAAPIDCCKNEEERARSMDLHAKQECLAASILYQTECQIAQSSPWGNAGYSCEMARVRAETICNHEYALADAAYRDYLSCRGKTCTPGIACELSERPHKRRILPGGLTIEEPQ